MGYKNASAANLTQLWFTQPNGAIYKRGGNGNGWSGSWKHIYSEAGGNIVPTSSHTYSIGSSTNAWSYLYGRYFLLRDVNGVSQGGLQAATAGTTDTDGCGYVILGNNTASGTAGNARGRIRLFDKTTYYTDIITIGENTANRTIYLPDKSGTLLCSSSGNLNMPITYHTANTDYSEYLLRGIGAGTSSAPSSMVNGAVYLKYS